MHAQLEKLLEIQDLKTQRRELRDTPSEREMQEEVFGMEVEEALAQLDKKIAEMEGSLEPAVRARYERVAGKRTRVVAPVIGGVCYGCFVAVPTALSSDAARNDELSFCDSCGRFLYHVD
jgi:predicted  nucleic acid-binding Zn-ribbon protein